MHVLSRVLVQGAEDTPPAAGQRDDLPAAVQSGSIEPDQPVCLEPAEDAAQVTGVEAEALSQLDGLHLVALCQLEEDPGFGQRIGRALHAVTKNADGARVEAVEPPH